MLSAERYLGVPMTIGAVIVAYTILGVPYCTYSIVGPKTLFELLRPLY